MVRRETHRGPAPPRALISYLVPVTTSSDHGIVPGEVVRVGLLGCGNVGGALVEIIDTDEAERSRRDCGVHLEVTRIAVRNVARCAVPALGAASGDPTPHSVVERPRRRRRRRAHRRDRAGAQPDRRGADGRKAGRHRQQGAARELRRRAQPPWRGQAGRGAAVRGGGRRGDPSPSRAARSPLLASRSCG